GTRTPVFAVRGRRPGPLDEGSRRRRRGDRPDGGPAQAGQSFDRSSPRKRGPRPAGSVPLAPGPPLARGRAGGHAPVSIRTIRLRHSVTVYITNLLFDFETRTAYIPPSLAHRGALHEAFLMWSKAGGVPGRHIRRTAWRSRRPGPAGI